MLSRALSLAAAILISCIAAPASAQNLDAGKSPVQIFNGSCAACHKSVRGLLKTVSPSSLSGFLRQHYTTGNDMAQMLSSYLISNGVGAVDPHAGSIKRGGKPDALQAEVGQPGRKPHPPKPDAVAQPLAGAPLPVGVGPLSAKQKLARKNRKGDEQPRTEPIPMEPAPEVVSKPESEPAPIPERSIEAAIPAPDLDDLPPLTATDIKSESPSAEIPKTVSELPKLPSATPSAPAAALAEPPAPPISQ